MKKSIALTIIALLAVAVIALGALFYTTNANQITQIAGLNADVADRDTQIAGLNADIADRDTQIAGLNADVADRDTQIAGLNADVADRDTQIAGLNADVADRDTQIAGLNADVADRDASISALTASVTDLNAGIADRDVQIADRDASISTLTASVTDLNAQVDGLSADVADRDATISALTAEKDEALQTVSTLQTDLAEAKKTAAQHQRAYEKSQRELEKSKQKLQAALKAADDCSQMTEEELLARVRSAAPYLEKLGYTVVADLIPWICSDCEAENTRNECAFCGLSKKASLLHDSLSFTYVTSLNLKSSDAVVAYLESTRLYRQDFPDDIITCPALKVRNISDKAQSVTTSAIVDGKTYTWKARTIQPGKDFTFYVNLQGQGLITGTHETEWLVNDISVLKKSVRVHDSSSGSLETIRKNFSAEMELVIKDKNNSNVTVGLTSGNLSQLKAGEYFAPRFTVTNAGENATHDMTLVLNDKLTYRFENQLIRSGKTLTYHTIGNDASIGENTCVCYVDGVEVARWNFTITDDTK